MTIDGNNFADMRGRWGRVHEIAQKFGFHSIENPNDKGHLQFDHYSILDLQQMLEDQYGEINPIEETPYIDFSE